MLEDGIPANIIQFPAVRSEETVAVLNLALNMEQAQQIHQDLERLSVAANQLGRLSKDMGLLAQHLDSRLSCFNISVAAPSPVLAEAENYGTGAEVSE